MEYSGQGQGAIVNGLYRFVADGGLNKLSEPHQGITIYDAPLVGFAAADDPLFKELQKPEVIAPDHMLPTDWLANAKSVISYFLPFSNAIREANYAEGWPADEWVYARIDGEDFNNEARRFLVNLVAELGGEALAPVLDERFATHEVRSNWSERHIAFVAGLGTFNLHRSLITEKGCAGRFGSIVTNLKLAPTPRPYRESHEYCRQLSGGSCGECIPRCPVNAINDQGKDIGVCRDFVENVIKPKFHPRYGCGKCQVDVACETCIPNR